ncbi:MAG: hypothetical protein IT507_01945 [Burkholderiaceae bacterium]|nr:hypothetical protein [Burkholderiaceae bacterium]
MLPKKSLCALILTLMLAACASTSVTGVVDADDQREIDAASCAELIEAYPDYVSAERELVAAIKQSNQTSAAINLVGVATFATLGLGLFSLDTNTDAQDALAEIRGLRIALETAINQRNCRK